MSAAGSLNQPTCSRPYDGPDIQNSYESPCHESIGNKALTPCAQPTAKNSPIGSVLRQPMQEAAQHVAQQAPHGSYEPNLWKVPEDDDRGSSSTGPSPEVNTSPHRFPVTVCIVRTRAFGRRLSIVLLVRGFLTPCSWREIEPCGRSESSTTMTTASTVICMPCKVRSGALEQLD